MLVLQALVLPFFLFPETAEAEGSRGDGTILYVDDDAPDGGNGSLERPFNSIQNALNFASPKDVIRVFEGTYNEQVVVSKTISLIGNGSTDTVITYENGDVVTLTASRVNISGFRITGGGWGAGIKVESDNNTILQNRIMNKNYGIHLFFYGNNTLSENNCSFNTLGIFLTDSSYNTLSSNTLYENTNYGIYLSDGELRDNVILNTNTINGRNPLFYYDEHGTEADPIVIKDVQDGEGDSRLTNLGYVILYNCSDFILENIKVTHCSKGIQIERSHHIEVFSCNISVVDTAVGVRHCDHVIIENNYISNNTNGISLFNSNNNTIQHNECAHNKYGVKLDSSSGNLLVNNTCTLNTHSGIYLSYGSNENTVKENNVSSNFYGIHVYENSDDNTLAGNDCFENYYGIFLLEDCENNIITLNNCSNNTNGIYVTWGSTHSTIQNNTCNDNEECGIHLFEGCNDSIISGNTCSNNSYGIYLEKSGHNMVTKNILNNNSNFGIYLEDGKLNDNIIANDNVINGKNLQYYYHEKGSESDPIVVRDKYDTALDTTMTNLAFLILYNCSYFLIENISTTHSERGITIDKSSQIEMVSINLTNSNSAVCIRDSSQITMKNNSFSNNIHALSLYHSSSNTIYGNNCSDNDYGIRLESSGNNNLTNNSCISNTNHGIFLHKDCNNNTLIQNNCSFNKNGIYLLDNCSTNIIADNTCTENDYGIYMINSTHNKILNNTCSNNDYYGIYLCEDCSNTIITGNKCSYNRNGIYLHGSMNNGVRNNTCTLNDRSGITIAFGSENNTISGNNCSNNEFGVYLRDSLRNTIEKNTMNNNSQYGIFFEDRELNDNIILGSNVIQGGAPYVYMNENGTKGSPIVVQGLSDSVNDSKKINLGFLIVHNCSYLILQNISIDDAGHGIYVDKSMDIEIISVYVSGIISGISLRHSYALTVKNSTFSDNTDIGLSLFNITDTVIENNTATDNEFGIKVENADGNMIMNNTCESNQHGINFTNSSFNLLANNSCSFNSRNGISAYNGCNNNSIENNTCTSNSRNGIDLGNDCRNNTISNNTLTFNNGDGLSLHDGSNDNFVRDNNCSENTIVGIKLVKVCINNIIINNSCKMNGWAGLGLMSGSNLNVITDNNLSQNSKYGIYIFESAYNTIDENVINGNSLFGILFYKKDLNRNKVTRNNTINGFHPHYYMDEGGSALEPLIISDLKDTPISGKSINVGFIILVNCSNIQLENISINYANNGIHITGSSHIVLISSMISCPDTGITLTRSLNCTFDNISVNECNDAVLLTYTKDSLVSNCTISNNTRGIALEYAEYNFIQGNHLFHNEKGIHLLSCCNNTISSNNLSRNVKNGVELESYSWTDGGSIFINRTSDNHIQNNTITHNGDEGILIDLSYNNYLNNNTISNSPVGIRVIKRMFTISGAMGPKNVNITCTGNEAHFNNITECSNYGVDASDNGSALFDATYNWWGDASGPYHPHDNPNGIGNKVSNYVIFSPWIGKPKTIYNIQKDTYYYTIREAIDAAGEGDTIQVHEAIYREDVVVTKSVNLIGNGSGKTVIRPMAPYRYFPLGCQYLIRIVADGVNISGFDVSGNGNPATGILVESEYNRIFNNDCSGNYQGISLVKANDNVVEHNNCSENIQYGIWLNGANRNTIQHNDLRSAAQENGIYLKRSGQNIIQHNTILEHSNYGIYLMSSRESTIRNNTIKENKKGMVLTRSNYTIISDNTVENNEYVGLILDGSAFCVIRNNTLQGSEYGILLGEKSVCNTMQNNTCLDNVAGIRIMYGFENKVKENILFDNKYGIHISSSHDNTIEGNTIEQNEEGIHVFGSYDDILSDNNITSNEYSGMNLSFVTGARIHLNIIGPGNKIGLLISQSLNPTINNNTIHNNEKGMIFSSSPECMAQYNNIFENKLFGVDASFNNAKIVNATNCYWGDPSGPHHDTKNPAGKGDNVTDYVDFEPYATESLVFAVIESIEPLEALDIETVSFRGRGVSFDSTIMRYVWNSTIDGEIYNGTNASFTRSDLTNGTHTIYLYVMDDRGIWSRPASACLIINGKPRVNLDLPSWILEGEDILLKGNVIDDGEIVRYQWRSSREGLLYDGSNEEFIWKGPSWGKRIIYFRVMDDRGAWSDTAQADFGVYARPIAHIDLITPEHSIRGDTIHFKGHGTDYLGIDQYVWHTSNGDKVIGTSEEFDYSGLSNGTHIISFRVRNTNGVWSEWVTQTITINGIPKAVIESISPNPATGEDTILFKGKGLDDGKITRYIWNSSIDGEIYNGTYDSFSTIHLSFGIHNISLIVKDDNGIYSEAVNSTLVFTMRPFPKIDKITPNPAYIGERISFIGNGTDDGNITLYHWRSDIDGLIYNGSEPIYNTSSISPGIHTIYFRIMDDMGIWSDEIYSVIEVFDNKPPQILILGPEDNATVNGTVSIYGTTWDDGKVSRVEYRIEGSEGWKVLTGQLRYWNIDWDTTTVSNKTYTFVFRSHDGTLYSSPVYLNLTVANEKQDDVMDEDEEDDALFTMSLPFIVLVILAILTVIGFAYHLSQRKSHETMPDQKKTEWPTLQGNEKKESRSIPQGFKEMAPKRQPDKSDDGIPRVQPGQSLSEGTWVCPKCGKRLDGKFIFCTDCGFRRG